MDFGPVYKTQRTIATRAGLSKQEGRFPLLLSMIVANCLLNTLKKDAVVISYSDGILTMEIRLFQKL